ncbi:hypothetical protein BDZ91DRAFT_789754 [Kalaharituber pfeilii]|nr:hypothetical protein BDZ91DRAFT_789754 [Kalaharituber pfeilii]
MSPLGGEVDFFVLSGAGSSESTVWMGLKPRVAGISSAGSMSMVVMGLSPSVGGGGGGVGDSRISGIRWLIKQATLREKGKVTSSVVVYTKDTVHVDRVRLGGR